MTTTANTLDHLNVAYFKAADKGSTAPVVTLSKNADGTATFEGLKIFKAGTFKDSLGIQHTWEPEHLQQMVFNFELLKSRGTFPNVPVRADHSFSVNSVIGYITSLSVQDGFLFAAGEITEPDAVGKIERGTFRARSSEIGMYETNDEVFFWPVLMGFAFVDIGAVEGLFSSPNTNKKFTPVTDQEEPPVTTNNDDKGPFAFQVAGQQTSNFAQVQAHITTLESENAALKAAAAAAGPAAFTIAGRETSDHAAVQTHITTLETALSDLDMAGRAEFVKKLAGDKKIGATQVEAMTKHAQGLSADQFTDFKALYENAPVLPLLGNHGDGITNPDNSANDGGEPTEVETLEAIVAMSRRSGLSEEAVQKTRSYKRLMELKASTK